MALPVIFEYRSEINRKEVVYALNEALKAITAVMELSNLIFVLVG
jgi:hypothetical protein